jgi:hypothetical protein
VNKPATVNVGDADIRHGIKEYNNWCSSRSSTSYEFVGGSDIMMEMYENGELQQRWHQRLRPPSAVADQRSRCSVAVGSTLHSRASAVHILVS